MRVSASPERRRTGVVVLATGLLFAGLLIWKGTHLVAGWMNVPSEQESSHFSEDVSQENSVRPKGQENIRHSDAEGRYHYVIVESSVLERDNLSESPVLLHLFDSSGRHTGPLGALGAEEQIPNSRYDRGTGIQTLYFDDADTYSVQIVGTGSGEFAVRIGAFVVSGSEERLVAPLIFPVPIVSTADLRAQMTIIERIDQRTKLEIDVDGDGVVDERLQSRPDANRENI